MAPHLLLDTPVEDRLSLLELAREQQVAPPTAWRWAVRGVKGLRLPTIKIGHKRVTTRSAFSWWCATLTELANGAPAPVQIAETQDCEAVQNAELTAKELGL